EPPAVPLGIIGADFTLRAEGDASFPTRLMRYGQGYAYDDLKDRVVEKTDNLRARYPDIGIIWMIHFPPSRECAGFCGYKEMRYHHKIVEAAANSNVKLILAGHIHERKKIRLGELDIVCAGSGCLFAETGGNWLHHLEIKVERGVAIIVKKTDYQWNDAAAD